MTKKTTMDYHRDGFYEVRDADGNVRFQSLRQIDAEEHARKLAHSEGRVPEILFYPHHHSEP